MIFVYLFGKAEVKGGRGAVGLFAPLNHERRERDTNTHDAKMNAQRRLCDSMWGWLLQPYWVLPAFVEVQADLLAGEDPDRAE